MLKIQTLLFVILKFLSRPRLNQGNFQSYSTFNFRTVEATNSTNLCWVIFLLANYDVNTNTVYFYADVLHYKTSVKNYIKVQKLKWHFISQCLEKENNFQTSESVNSLYCSWNVTFSYYVVIFGNE